jgi:hypothetical protein
MRGHPSRVIAETNHRAEHSVHAILVHHRHFPDISAEGTTPAQGARRLMNLLSQSLDSVGSKWRHDAIKQALADVAAFLETRENTDAENRLAQRL